MPKYEAFNIINSFDWAFLGQIDQICWNSGYLAPFDLQQVNEKCFIGELGMIDLIKSLIYD